MRLSALLTALIALSSSTSSQAIQFPTPENPQARALLDRTQMDAAKLSAMLGFAKPAAQDWPCAPPLSELYQVAGIAGALPEDQLAPKVKAQMDESKRMMRKALRSSGMDPAMAPVSTFSNIELIPVKAQCVDGKLDGPVEYYLSFTSKMTSTMEQMSTLTNKVETNRNLMTDTVQMLIQRTYQAGEPQPGVRSIRRGSIVSHMTFENPAMQKMMDDSLSKTGSLNRASPSSSITFGAQDGVVAFTLNEEPKVTGGIFGINTAWTTKLGTMVMLTGAKVNNTYMYSDAQPLNVSRRNTETSTTESVTFMENYVKKMGKKLADMPNMENYREVVMGGKDMLEMRSCMVDNKPVKLDPCPVEE